MSDRFDGEKITPGRHIDDEVAVDRIGIKSEENALLLEHDLGVAGPTVEAIVETGFAQIPHRRVIPFSRYRDAFGGERVGAAQVDVVGCKSQLHTIAPWKKRMQAKTRRHCERVHILESQRDGQAIRRYR